MNAATELAAAYIEAWNETDAVQRRSLIEKAFMSAMSTRS